jgi:hypothetical protein
VLACPLLVAVTWFAVVLAGARWLGWG